MSCSSEILNSCRTLNNELVVEIKVSNCPEEQEEVDKKHNGSYVRDDDVVPHPKFVVNHESCLMQTLVQLVINVILS